MAAGSFRGDHERCQCTATPIPRRLGDGSVQGRKLGRAETDGLPGREKRCRICPYSRVRTVSSRWLWPACRTKHIWAAGRYNIDFWGSSARRRFIRKYSRYRWIWIECRRLRIDFDKRQTRRSFWSTSAKHVKSLRRADQFRDWRSLRSTRAGTACDWRRPVW